MDAPDLDDLCSHVNSKISKIKKTLQLRYIGQDPSLSNVLSKVTYELHLLCELLNKVETEVQRQEAIAKSLKELQVTLERDVKEASHLRDNVPPHLPKKCPNSNPGPGEAPLAEVKVSAPEPQKKPAKGKHIKEVELITVQEFDNVPAYMKNRLTYEKINHFIEEVNKAVVGKYKIIHQPLKTLNNVARKQLGRFKEEEMADTKGQFFIVEQDIKEFTQVKVDKRFHGMLSIMRHCHRIRELRGKGIVRYVIC
ncbi:spindle and kinetochore-associated protein 1 [Bufo bufo]|uniref:spindle and kinetochore-associated protein 1 n=1 Tax=Bufo bufo TaxID=8384 RepID=UPI001ABDB17D|nr:spindle and kinetochore-associated protein 1 [Bufo bufo]XP_040277034.1 spindle and kinetochore-associated protein 1 [Bufo bufo]